VALGWRLISSSLLQDFKYSDFWHPWKSPEGTVPHWRSNGRSIGAHKHTWDHTFTTFRTLLFCKCFHPMYLLCIMGLRVLTCSCSFGPNTFPAHNSALFSCEVQIEYVARTMIAPIIDGRASMIEVKDTAENQWVNSVQHQMSGSVFEAGCSNWYINEFGRNAASWPGFASAFWKETLIPRRGIFVTSKGSKSWMLNTGIRWLKTTSIVTYAILGLLLSIVYVRRISGTGISLRRLFEKAQGSLTKSLSALRS
jgi:hypothetical protein